MDILTFPTLGIRPSGANGFRLKHFTEIFPAPDVASQQRTEWDDPVWMASISFATLNDERRRMVDVFLNQLRGAYGTFYFGPYKIGYARGGAGGGAAPKVKGAGQTGRSLLIDGCSANITKWGALGDYFSFIAPDGRSYLFQLNAQANTNGSGEVTLSFDPEMRVAPADNADIQVVDPVCIMALTDDDQGQMTIRRPFLAATGLSLIEAAWLT